MSLVSRPTDGQPESGHKQTGSTRAPTAPSDADLVASTLAGEPGAYGQLYERHVGTVSRLIAFRVGASGVMEDLTQDVFVRALKALPTLREPDLFRSWLLRIAHNAIANHWRGQSRQPPVMSLDASTPGDDGDDTLGAELGAEDIEFERAEARVGARAVFEAAAVLSDLQRQVLALRFAAGLSLADSAEVMQRSPEAVKQLQYRALMALREQLASRETHS